MMSQTSKLSLSRNIILIFYRYFQVLFKDLSLIEFFLSPLSKNSCQLLGYFVITFFYSTKKIQAEWFCCLRNFWSLEKKQQISVVFFIVVWQGRCRKNWARSGENSTKIRQFLAFHEDEKWSHNFLLILVLFLTKQQIWWNPSLAMKDEG